MVYNVRLGDVFIFINRQRTTMKLLHTEDGGLPLYIKRLEKETFHLP
ncbi:IS66 family insertion sequence element accessory protein TnpB [Parabacteroides goldsteinii]|nr:IS66 family insertion sequence element accessory protein TnpB [Parabacteroides goldsteinii]